ncbi:MAG: DEAD/DEAH box helicase, partial [Candidatus Doudnabacteria bacterium]|nr:DEAD/DEAH box helicase [Candidatus Doudnabacteria bacterium]
GRRVNLSQVGILILDEADRMLDMGFAPQIKKILEKVPRERQTMLFSATMPDEIVKIASNYLTLPLRIEVAPAGSAVKTVTQEVFFVQRERKADLLKKLLEQYKGSVLVFTRTKHGAKKIALTVRRMGYTAAEIHSNRSLSQRIEALEGFKIGRYRVMVATDIAARGIDVTGIQLVLNFDLPATAEDYVHRIGRTGRAGLAGHAISFATPDQKSDVRSIERLIRTTLPVSQTPVLQTSGLPQVGFRREPEEPRPERRNFDPRRRPQGRGRGEKKDYKKREREIPKPSRPVFQGRGYFMKRNTN